MSRNMPELPIYVDPDVRQVEFDSDSRLIDEEYGVYQSHRGENKVPGSVQEAAQRAGNLPADLIRFREV